MSDLDTMRRDRNRALDRLRKRRITLAQIQGIPTSLVDAAPIRTRINELAALGWSYEALAHLHGQGTASGLRLIANGVHTKAERKFERVAELPLTLHVPNTLPDTMWVPSLGATRRIQGLLRLGWRHEDIAEQAGRSVHVFAGNSRPLRTRAIDWRIIDTVFDRLSAAPGDSVKTRTRAERAGYIAPLGWRDIDNPREQPRPTHDTTDRGDLFRELHELGYGINETARRLNIDPESLRTWASRTGHIETYRVMLARDRGAA